MAGAAIIKQNTTTLMNTEKTLSGLGSISGIASILGSWQVCHNVCLGIIAALSILGITVVGMPLAFLTTIAIPVWSVAFALLIITAAIYFTKKCISRNLLIFNTGLIIAGIPFPAVQKFTPAFFTIGGALVAASIILYIKERHHKKTCMRCHHEN